MFGLQTSFGGASIVAPEVLKREIRRAFLGLFTLCLVVPLLQTFYPLLQLANPVEERRLPSPFPSLRLIPGEDGEFAAQLNKWFADRVGLRDFFIRSKNQIDYSLFHTSRKVYIGNDGWLFIPEEATRDLDAATLAALEERYLTLARRLGEKGVRLVVVGYPAKSTIYPDKAPPDMPLMAAGGNYDRFRRFLAAQPDLIFVDAQDILERSKADATRYPLFYKTDPHPTLVAQIPVVKQIIERIAQAEGRSDLRWDEKLAFADRRAYGIAGMFLALLFPPWEHPPTIVDGYQIGANQTDGDWEVNARADLFERADEGAGRPFDWEFRSRPDLCPQRLPGIVLFGNSMSDGWWPLGFHRYFCFSRRARNPISRFKLFYDTMPAGTKYFIFQYYEPWLTEVIADPWFSNGAPQPR
jgi:hypothetical protein